MRLIPIFTTIVLLTLPPAASLARPARLHGPAPAAPAARALAQHQELTSLLQALNNSRSLSCVRLTRGADVVIRCELRTLDDPGVRWSLPTPGPRPQEVAPAPGADAPAPPTDALAPDDTPAPPDAPAPDAPASTDAPAPPDALARAPAIGALAPAPEAEAEELADLLAEADALALEAAPAPDPGPAPAPVSAEPDPEEARVLALLNQERRRHGLDALTLDPAASRVARLHGQDMCARRYFDHLTPEGRAPWDRLTAGGVSFKAAAENIAKGHLSAADVHQGWMNSPGHRKNMLTPGYTRAGIGLYRCGQVLYWTQLFMGS